jgi:hypothetical protein
VFRSFFLKISVDHDHKICDRQITKCDHKSQNHLSQNFVISKRRRSGNRCILASILDFRRKPSFFWFVADVTLQTQPCCGGLFLCSNRVHF